MGCFSPDAPPPPRDYSEEVDAWGRAEQRRYDDLARNYNAVSNAYNQRIAGFGNELSGLRSQLSGLTIADRDKIDNLYSGFNSLLDKYDDPWTVEVPRINSDYHVPTSPSSGGPGRFTPRGQVPAPGSGEVPAGDYQFPGGNGPPLPGMMDSISISGLAGFNYDRPDFQRTATTPYDSWTVSLNIPSLVNPNTSLATQYYSDITNALSQLDNLKRQRQSEIDRVNSYKSNLEGSISDLGSRANTTDISSLGNINALAGELNRLRTQQRGFSSPLLAEFGGLDQFDPQYNEIQAQIDKLLGERSAEEQRVSDYQLNMQGLLDRVRQNISNFDIDKIDEIRALDSEIDQAAIDARRFQSKIPFDFGALQSEYYDLNSMIDSLYARHKSEEERIKSEESSLEDMAFSLRDQLGQLDPFNKAGIDAARSTIEAALRRSGRFTSPLPFDLSQEIAPLNEAQARLAGILDTRASRLGEYSSKLDQFRNSLAGTPLYDEEATSTLLNEIMGTLGEFGGFAGDDVRTVRDQYNSVLRDINARSGQLSKKRSGIESNARNLLRNFEDRDFYTEDDVKAARGQVGSLEREIELYKAQQAFDELDQLERALDAQMKRLQADAQRTAEVRAAEQDAVRRELDPYGGLRFPTSVSSPLMTEDQYLAYLAKRSRDINQWPGYSGTFSSMVGI